MQKNLAKVRVQIIDENTKLPKEDVDVITSADAVYFPDGDSFQDKLDKGLFQGEPGEDGKAATIRIGQTITSQPGISAKVENVGTMSAAILNFTIPKGEKGNDGTSIKINSRFDTYEELVALYPDGTSIDGGFLIGPEGGPCDYYYWDHNIKQWSSMGSIKGEKGDPGVKGDPGEDGMGLAILTSVTNYNNLIELYPDGSVCNGWGILTNDTREYWYWDKVKLAWKSAGSVIGAKGDPGEKGDAATIVIGNVTTGAPGSNASVTNVGTSNNAILDIVIPRGDTGAMPTIDNEITNTSNNPVSSSAIYKALDYKSDKDHNHLYAGSNSPGGAANTALECTGNSATATKAEQDSDGEVIKDTYVADVSVTDKQIIFLSKSGETLATIDKSNSYNLPAATENTLGGVKIDTDSISISNGTLSINASLKIVASGQFSKSTGSDVNGIDEVDTTPSTYGGTVTCPDDIKGDNGLLICISWAEGRLPNNSITYGIGHFGSSINTIKKGTSTTITPNFTINSSDYGMTINIKYWILSL